MATYVVTGPKGGMTFPMPATVARPEHMMDTATAAQFAPGLGLNSAFFADLMSSFLAHERCGVHLYRAAAGLVTNPEWRDRFLEFGRQTEEHVEILEDLVTRLGGDPMYVSPAARMTEFTDTKLMEPVLLAGSVSQETLELTCLEAVVLAERKCHNNWTFLSQLSAGLPEGSEADALRDAVARVEQQEDEHVAWAEAQWTAAVAAALTGV